MKYDFYSEYTFLKEQKVSYKVIDRLVFAKNSDYYPDLKDYYSGLNLLALSMFSGPKILEDLNKGEKRYEAHPPVKEYSISGFNKEKGFIRSDGVFGKYLKKMKNEYINPLKLDMELPDITILPPLSFSLQFKFELDKPYISKDDKEFYILDNPVRKEKVFKVPYIAPSQWKGMLRNAIYDDDESNNSDDCEKVKKKNSDDPVIRLFGNDNQEDDQNNLKSGRLIFYPTFFYSIGYQAINLHSRETGAGKFPIYYECVPADTKGLFKILYVPFDRSEEDYAETRREIKDDLTKLSNGIKTLFITKGLGAKTSSQFGAVKNKIEDVKFAVNSLKTPMKEVEEAKAEKKDKEAEAKTFEELCKQIISAAKEIK